MKVTMRVTGYTNGSICEFTGQYIMNFDFAAEQGIGKIWVTPVWHEALVFMSEREALTSYYAPSPFLTLEGGLVYRPLTHYTVELVPYEHARKTQGKPRFTVIEGGLNDRV
jgi:hypothetical protein